MNGGELIVCERWKQYISDQPGRYVAVLFIAPVLYLKGLKYDDYFIIGFAVVLFAWDMFWLLFKKRCEV